MAKTVQVGNISISNDSPLFLIAGPCAMESRDVALRVADYLKIITDELKIPFIFKASFDKANRTSVNAKRGVGIDEALKIFQEIQQTYNVLTITDVHESVQCEAVASVVDVLQIPAFLCRQTDLLAAAAKTQKAIHIKKGQFLSPWEMKNVHQKVAEFGNNRIILCERGSCFGYNRLISDMRSLKIMSEFEYPVTFDATHSVQEPGALGGSSGGNRTHVELLARAAVAVGVSGLYIETHFDPNNAICDGPNMIPLHLMKDFLISMQKFDALAKQSKYLDMSC